MNLQAAAGRAALVLVFVAALVGLAWLAPPVLLFAAPWLVPIALLLRRHGVETVAPGNADELPSAAELARRRLSVR